jgi:hypothetical protein
MWKVSEAGMGTGMGSAGSLKKMAEWSRVSLGSIVVSRRRGRTVPDEAGLGLVLVPAQLGSEAAM